MRNLMKSGVKKRRAFTLIELLVVIAIIGILAAIIVVLLNSARRRAQDAQIKSDVTSMSQALEIVKVDRNLVNSGGYQPLNEANGNDSNISWWCEDAWHPGLPGTATKRLVDPKPTHPLTGEAYWINVLPSGADYGLVARLNPTGNYLCNVNGTTRTLTGMADIAAARTACAVP